MNLVVAVTVTYNDAEYLKKCIRLLQNQTVEIFKIVVVNNNSNDENNLILHDLLTSKIDLLNLNDNLGGAGGFEYGMRYAKEHYNPDWYWIMDADSYPNSNCLEKLLESADIVNNSEEIGFLAPVIFGYDLNEYQLYHHKKLSRFLDRDLWAYSCIEDVPSLSRIEADAFVGPLFSRTAVELMGFPDGSLFIYGDDQEYTYRITRKMQGVLVKTAVINHRDQPSNDGIQKPENWWKDYYMYRNRLLFIRKYQKNIIKRFIGIILVLLRCLKQGILALFLSYPWNLKVIRERMLVKAFNDGIKSKTGKTIDPTNFKNKL